MMIEKYNAKDLEYLLMKKKMACLEDLKKELGTASRNTVLRKLNELGYETSYSHKGMFYSLKRICKFNDIGLWSQNKIWFSKYGTLLNTGRNFIERSAVGLSVSELDKVLSVSTKLALSHLVKLDQIKREKFNGIYIYFSNNKKTRELQILKRNEMDSSNRNTEVEVLGHELKASIVLFFSILDERQRRFFAGIESMKIGEGGDARVAAILGIDPHTVSKGRQELLDRDINIDNIRKRGGGRKSIEKKLQRL